jgi:hypothetical protein
VRHISFVVYARLIAPWPVYRLSQSQTTSSLSSPSEQITKMPLLSALSDPLNPVAFSQISRVNCYYPNSRLSVKMTRKPLTRATAAIHGSYQLREGQKRYFHQLPSGLNMEVIEQKPPAHVADTWKGAPPLVLVHGSFHAAWCWAEHWMPFFSSSGLHCYAVSLLGQVGFDPVLSYTILELLIIYLILILVT